MAHENTIPLISKTAFSCPHCGAYTTQHWYKMNAAPYDEDNRTPMIPDESLAEKFRNERDISEEEKHEFIKWVNDMHGVFQGSWHSLLKF
ncbi:hypothetical protein [Shewanella sp. T24-MNA-CIBAN-0130]|uniref:hypothetical protein n=1 Tax=Shewanella sp. T24-MNA-CIBAN-0130 TaxID=3140470 RepID=UPI00332A3270